MRQAKDGQEWLFCSILSKFAHGLPCHAGIALLRFPESLLVGVLVFLSPLRKAQRGGEVGLVFGVVVHGCLFGQRNPSTPRNAACLADYVISNRAKNSHETGAPGQGIYIN